MRAELQCSRALAAGAMYIFVFMWTPALENTSTHEIYHGWIFASFMVSHIAAHRHPPVSVA
jgi:hypothetical protein